MNLKLQLLLYFLLFCLPLSGFAAMPMPKDSEDHREIDTLLVVGTRIDIASAEADAARTPGGVSVVNLDAYRNQAVTNLTDVLRYVPGIWVSSTSGTDDVFVSSRGSNLDATGYDMNGIKLLQDGLPVTTADGNNHNRVIDPMSARYGVVARGANALKYGASTLGGAINFVTATAQDEARMDFSLNGGSHDLLQGRFTVSELWNDRYDALVTVEHKDWGGFRDHNEQDRLGLYANAGWQVSARVSTRFYATWLDNDQALPGSLTREQVEADPAQANASAVSGNFQLNVETHRLANRTVWEISPERSMEFGLSYEEQTLFHPIVDRVLVDFDGPGPEQPVEVFSLLIDTDHQDVGAMMRFNQRVGRHEFVFGANYGQNDADGGNFRNLGGLPNGMTTVIENSAESLEVFAMDTWQASEQLNVILAAQGVHAKREVRNTDVRTDVLTNPHDTYSALNPRIGAVYDLRQDVALYTNLSRLFEPPTNFELQDDVSGGDTTLDAMSGTVLEVGTRGTRDLAGGDLYSWDVSVYYASIDDEILSVEDPAAPGTSLVTNMDETVHAGIEALLSARFGLGTSGAHTLEPLISATFNDFRFADDPVYGDNELPAAPDFAIRGEIMYRHMAGYYFGPTFEWVGTRHADFINSYRIGGHELFGLRGGWTGESWSAFIEVENLFDETYISTHSVRNVATENDAILNPGAPRSVYAGLRWRFE